MLLTNPNNFILHPIFFTNISFDLIFSNWKLLKRMNGDNKNKEKESKNKSNKEEKKEIEMS